MARQHSNEFLVNAFNNTNNYFTTYQASTIQLVSAENNRLQLAKLLSQC
ncbi:MAG: hypothetical protein IPQ06_08800 [Chitinophagaceae bacterium]|nr:hypothetical protein [Chitinophagaceae bacterium]